jgi:hypothetical protein
MSQEGANRWARGHECSYIGARVITEAGNLPGTPWNVSWLHGEQIIAHYFTSIHIYDPMGNRLTPNYRWNALQLISETPVPPGHIWFATIWVQNTGTQIWYGDNNSNAEFPVALSYRLYQDSTCVANCHAQRRSILPQDFEIAPGETYTFTLSAAVPLTQALGCNYTMRWDMARLEATKVNTTTQATDVLWFSEQTQPWYTQDVIICVGWPVYLPLISKQA